MSPKEQQRQSNVNIPTSATGCEPRCASSTSETLPAALPSYLMGEPPSFLAQADVRFVAAGGCELPAHSQFLARGCLLFSELLDPDGGVQGRPTPTAPLRVALEQHSAADIERTLRGIYQPHKIEALVAGLQGPTYYGAQLDLAAFLRFGQLLDALRAPLARRSQRMGELVQFDFAGWLEVAERHNLDALKSYCLECLLHLLVTPGCTGRPDEPRIDQLDWDAVSKRDLLLLLDGLASGVRRCTRGSYDMQTWVPCTAAPRAGYGSPPTTTPAAAWAGLLPTGQVLPPTPPRTPLASPSGSGGASTTPIMRSRGAGDHLATVSVPKLRRTDIAGSMPGEAAINGWQHMGDLCRGADL